MQGYQPVQDEMQMLHDDGEIDTSRTKTKRKAFYSFTEFCFFDQHTGKAFGYGIDVVETKFNGELLGFLVGAKMDAGGHVIKMARSLADLFRRADGGQAKKYSARELIPVKTVFEKDNTREILDETEE